MTTALVNDSRKPTLSFIYLSFIKSLEHLLHKNDIFTVRGTHKRHIFLFTPYFR